MTPCAEMVKVEVASRRAMIILMMVSICCEFSDPLGKHQLLFTSLQLTGVHLVSVYLIPRHHLKWSLVTGHWYIFSVQCGDSLSDI